MPRTKAGSRYSANVRPNNNPPVRTSPYTKPRHEKQSPPPPPDQSGVLAMPLPKPFNSYSTSLVGHSFIRQFKHTMLASKGITDQQQGLSHGDHYRDITDRDTAAIMLQALSPSPWGLRLRYHRVYTHARKIVFIEDLVRDIEHILPRIDTPDSLLVNIGSNDLSRLTNNFLDAQVIALAGTLRDFVQFHVPNHIIVVCMGVVPRPAGGPHLSAARFRDAMRIFNGEMRRFEIQAENGEQPTNLRFNKMRGWDYTQVGNQHVELDPATWCGVGGIHPTDQMFRTKFCESVVRALTMSKNRPIYAH